MTTLSLMMILYTGLALLGLLSLAYMVYAFIKTGVIR